MNILGLVFSILLMISFAFYTTWDKHLVYKKLATTYQGHEISNRKILNQYQSKIYKKLGKKGKKEKKSEEKKKPSNSTPPLIKTSINRECAKINLWDLAHDGKEKHLELYELTQKTLKTLYSPINTKIKHFESLILDQLLSKIKAVKDPIALEKIDLENVELQKIYYKMLKGSKSKTEKYPPLLDYITVTSAHEKICIYHANFTLLEAIFGNKIATKIHHEIHTENHHVVTFEMIERFAQESHQVAFSPATISLIELKYFPHEESVKAFTAKDKKSQVELRKDLAI